MQKGVIKDIPHGENGREQNADWLPGHFRFPTMAHTEHGGITVVDKWKNVAELINPAS